MIQVVLDTNVLVAALRSRRGASYALLDTLSTGTWQPNVSVALALEYEDVLKREGIVALSGDKVDGFLRFLLSKSNLPAGVERLRPTLRDADDDRILEVAVQCRAAIVTHNVRDFSVANRYRVDVWGPAEFPARLRESV